jgi:glycosyltransferase involved in cell wall biosynthesis
MTKNKTVKYHPFVSIVCVTFNRRPFIPTLLQCIRNQDYPASRYEVIIVDDGTDKIKDLISEANFPQVKYFELPEKLTLGKKRNYSHTLVDKRCKYISYFDDDDYHHPSRISHSVEMLEKNPKALCAGASEIYVYFKHLQQMYQLGPYGPLHSTAGTFTFRRELLDITAYDDNACLAEERHFLKDYTIPFVQLDPLKTILVISHEHNTFDKRKLLENPNPKTTKPSDKTIEMFISKKKNEIKIMKFFFEDIDELLKQYIPGESKNKPDVLQQIKEIEFERQQLSNNNQTGICIEKPGEKPICLSQQEIVNLITSQRDQITFYVQQVTSQRDQIAIYDNHIKELEQKIISLQNVSIQNQENDMTVEVQ